MINKAKHPARLYPSGLAYFLFRRLPAAFLHNLHHIANGAFLIYIIGIRGGADIRHVTDSAIILRVLLGMLVWAALLAIYFIARETGRKEKKQNGRNKN